MHCKQALLPRARGVGWRHATNYTPVLAQQPVAGRVARLRKAHTSSTAARSSVRAIKRSSDAGVSSASSAFSPADLSHERTNAVSQQVDHTLQQHHQQQDAQLPGGILLLSLISAAGGVLGSGFSLEGPWSVAEALGVLAAIITVHECGHFLAARSQGIHVTEFSIGFGPQIWKRKAEGDPVEYSLRAVPLGGYVAFPDDDPKSGFAADDPDLLNNRPLSQRALVISAGVIANIIFAFGVLFAQVGTIGKAESAYLPGVRVPDVTLGGVAERAGIRSGDVLLRVGEYEVRAAPDQVAAVVSTIKAHPNEELAVTLQRGGRQLTVPVVPLPGRDGRGAIGVSLYSNSYIKHTKPDSLGGVFSMTVSEFNRITGIVLGGLKSIITNFSGMASQLSGPVAIVAKGSEIARTDSAGLFQFCAIVNINLAAVNLLPLPALDGGYLLLLAIEALRGKKLPQALEQGVMASGLLVMMFLGVGLVIRDTINLL